MNPKIVILGNTHKKFLEESPETLLRVNIRRNFLRNQYSEFLKESPQCIPRVITDESFW